MKTLIWETHDDGAYATTPAELLADNHGDEAVADAVAYLKGEAKKRGFHWSGVCFGGGASGLTFITVRHAGVVLPHEDEMADCCLYESDVPRRAPLRTIKRRTPNAMDEIHRKAEAAFSESDRQMQERADAAARSEAEARRAQAEAQRQAAEAEAARKRAEAEAYARARAEGAAAGKTGNLQMRVPVWTPDTGYTPEDAYAAAYAQAYKQSQNDPEAQRRRAETERQRQEAERQRQQQQQQQPQQRPLLKERKALFTPNPPPFADRRRSNPSTQEQMNSVSHVIDTLDKMKRLAKKHATKTDEAAWDKLARKLIMLQISLNIPFEERIPEIPLYQDRLNWFRRFAIASDSAEAPWWYGGPIPHSGTRKPNPTASRFVLLDAGQSAGHHGADDRYTLICTAPQGSGSRAYYNYLGFGTGVSAHGEFTASEFRALKAEGYRSLGKRIKIEALPANMRRLAESFIADCG